MIWKKAESAERPIELDTTSSKTVNYVRKNIVEVKREQPDGTSMTMYEFDELEVPKADWLLFNGLSESTTRIAEAEDAIIELAGIIGGNG